MSYTTYILMSKIAKKTYTGHTDDLERRLIEHNRGKGIFSRRYKPWEILYKEEFLTELEAIKKEAYFKSATGRRWMSKNLFDKS